jgi:hypothetical protein
MGFVYTEPIFLFRIFPHLFCDFSVIDYLPFVTNPLLSRSNQ